MIFDQKELIFAIYFNYCYYVSNLMEKVSSQSYYSNFDMFSTYLEILNTP